MAKRHPYLRLFPNDRAFDPKLRLCSRAARDFWGDLYGVVAHFAEPRGYVLVEGRAPTNAELGRMFGDSEADVAGYLDELERNGVFSRTGLAHPLGGGVIFCRRMVREAEKAERDAANGALGGNPELNAMRDVAEHNAKRALSDFEKKARTAERVRRHRAKKKAGEPETTVTPVTPNERYASRSVTLPVTVDKRYTIDEKPMETPACDAVTGVKAHLLLSIPNVVPLPERSSSLPVRRPPLESGGSPGAPTDDERANRLAELRRKMIEADPEAFTPEAEAAAERAFEQRRRASPGAGL